MSDGQILEEVSKPLHVKDLSAQAKVLRAENNDWFFRIRNSLKENLRCLTNREHNNLQRQIAPFGSVRSPRLKKERFVLVIGFYVLL